MPYFTIENCEKLKGKTVERIEGRLTDSHHSITIYWTDGTHSRIFACVEHEQRPKRQVNLIVNNYEGHNEE